MGRAGATESGSSRVWSRSATVDEVSPACRNTERCRFGLGGFTESSELVLWRLRGLRAEDLGWNMVW